MVELHIEMTLPNPYKIRDGLYDATKAQHFVFLVHSCSVKEMWFFSEIYNAHVIGHGNRQWSFSVKW